MNLKHLLGNNFDYRYFKNHFLERCVNQLAEVNMKIVNLLLM